MGGRKRLPVISVLMKVAVSSNEVNNDDDEGYNAYLQQIIDGFQHEYNDNMSRCANTVLRNRRLQRRRQKSQRSNLDTIKIASGKMG